MNKKMMLIALAISFQTTLYADNNQEQGGTVPSATDSKIIMPEVGSQYNLDGMQTHDGQYKSSYSTNSVDNRNAVEDKKSQNRQRLNQEKLNIKANNSEGVGVLIIVDE